MSQLVRIMTLTMMIIVTLNTAVAAQQPPPTETPSPTPTNSSQMQLQIQITNTPSIEEKLEGLGNRVNSVENQYQLSLKDLLTVVTWPIFLLTFAILFRHSVTKVLNNLALVISRSSISVGTVKLDPWNLTQVIVQREILRMAIFMASVDQDFDSLEMHHLASLASDMSDNLGDFPDDVAEAVLIAVINMATSDGIVKSSEYEAIIERSNQFKRSSSEIDNLIIEKCKLKGTTPPPQLQQRYDQEIGRHQARNQDMS